MSINYSTTKHPYCHLSEAERGKIEVYLSEGLTLAEIARRLGRHRSTISREIKRGTVEQVKLVNDKKVYYEQYFADAAQNRYDKARKGIHYLKLDRISKHFLTAFTEAMTAKPRVHSVDTFVHVYKLEHPEEIIPSTKTLYTYIHQGLMAIKPIDLPKVIRIRKKPKKRPSTKKHLGTSIDQRPHSINDRSIFGHWEIDSILGLKTAGEPVIMTLVERQTRYALTTKLPEKKAEYVNQAILDYLKSYPIKSITADNGSEFSLLSELEGIEVYFAHAYSSHERGTNENFNGLLREFVPKGVSLTGLTQENLAIYTQAINDKLRRIHNYQSAKKLFELAQTV
ncbi:IS30 family transposase [Streptococcus sp. CSL10205-OR2]|uniref:IS30 family transposase n=1 Tax=Streptococcus sp. CSL10205-OR2 TaxID=2980558 RepID=UPI0021D8CBB1|nr:IS30 family transposase [Streptococcus sp. CSL10205-OR2]MCU9534449.1 IS30 family transposase [Streptococcus sp. CSL10205-OR2]